jgi:hypothetical protein
MDYFAEFTAPSVQPGSCQLSMPLVQTTPDACVLCMQMSGRQAQQTTQETKESGGGGGLGGLV